MNREAASRTSGYALSGATAKLDQAKMALRQSCGR
jgi:hypothetical protein